MDTHVTEDAAIKTTMQRATEAAAHALSIVSIRMWFGTSTHVECGVILICINTGVRHNS